MNIVSNIRAWQEIRKKLSEKTIGFIPTMGNIHEGHISLCRRSAEENDVTVVSLFINPTQFNQAKDFDTYPRTIEEDTLVLSFVDYIFLPHANEMYPDDYEIRVTEEKISQLLEGQCRPGHFTGMLTIVLKLLNLIQPKRAYFGEKDYQQLLLVKKMVAALFLQTEIVGCPTIRAEDGLALSSRNSRLNAEQRKKAAVFPTLLQSHQSIDHIISQLNALGFKVEYIADQWNRRLGAVWLDDVRLIDNVSIK